LTFLASSSCLLFLGLEVGIQFVRCAWLLSFFVMAQNRRGSFDSDGGTEEQDVSDNMSSISESFENAGALRASHSDKNYISGYLLKKSKDGAWQKRFFETNGTFLTYYKSRKMTKLLAALNMPNVGEISLVSHSLIHQYRSSSRRLAISQMP
jgi:hypothetical protein